LFPQGISLIVAAPLALYMMWPIECEYPYLTAMVLLIMIEVLQLPADGLYYLVWRAWRLLQAKNKVAVEEEEKKKKAPLLLF
jgi:hypothetical protein